MENPSHYDIDPGKRLDHLMEQYKLCLEMADRISQRRNQVHVYFLTLHSTAVGAIALAFHTVGPFQHPWVPLLTLIPTLGLCLIWHLITRSYRLLNSAKYKVVGELEKELPASPFWGMEWASIDHGKNWRKYIPVTHVERWIPAVFGVTYLMLSGYFCCFHHCKLPTP